MLAQRYPDIYDGIIAGAPAIKWNKLVTSIQWPHQVMNELNQFPYPCELDAVTQAAISKCDGLDGVMDGVISNISGCFESFDPFSVVGTSIACAQKNDTLHTISEAAAIVVNATWHGPVTTDGNTHYHGVLPGADLTGNQPTSFNQPGIVVTTCDDKGCESTPSYLGTSWFKLFVAKNETIDLTSLTRDDFDALAHAGSQQFSSMIETDDPDLRRFQAAGGKIITFHGLVSEAEPS